MRQGLLDRYYFMTMQDFPDTLGSNILKSAICAASAI